MQFLPKLIGMESNNSQLLFFQHIKAILPDHISFVDEIADLLSISNDSAYRRIRGEKHISLEEMQKLASHYKISIDQFLHLQSDSYIFSGQLASAGDYVYEQWQENVLNQLTFVNSCPLPSSGNRHSTAKVRSAQTSPAPTRSSG